MIQSISIKNYALIEALDINFAKGLTIITGETGAGKSIVLGALGMILGQRADTKVLFKEDQKCIIEATFDVSKYDLTNFFETNEIDYNDITLVRRELTPQGKTRAFINDTPVNLTQLRALSERLVDLHQQFDTLEMNDSRFQMEMVDSLAGNKELLKKYKLAYSGLQSARRKLAERIATQVTASRELEFWKFQFDELEKAELVTDEQEKFEIELQQLQNAETIKRQLSGAFNGLTESENAAVGQLRSIAQAVSSVKKYNSKIAEQHQRLESMLYELEDIGAELENLSEKTEYNPERIVQINARLDAIYRLQKKHSVNSVPELITITNKFGALIESHSDASNEILLLQQEIINQEKELHALADKLSVNRKKHAPKFAQTVSEQLHTLGMEQAQLEIEFTTLPDFTENGIESVVFLFAANKGGKLRAIKDVASGGELSRLALCTKSLVAASIPLPTLIFDEIDSGVSGDVALKMGAILKKLAAHHQVVVITHSPQVASKAEKHYFVYKTNTAERTYTQMRELNKNERIRAIAVMLSQNPPSDSALRNAEELLVA